MDEYTYLILDDLMTKLEAIEQESDSGAISPEEAVAKKDEVSRQHRNWLKHMER